MKVVVFADSHTDVDTMRIVMEAEHPDRVIHLGDHVEDGIALREIYDTIPMELVKGNTDFTGRYESEKTIVLNGKRIFMTHGDRYHVEQGITHVLGRGSDVGADLILFGHTHKLYLRNTDGIWIMNPGRIGRRSSKAIHATYGILLFDHDAITCEIAEFDTYQS